jgi:hypothetical protein
MAQLMHPFLTPIGVRKDGRPIYPILGGSEPPTPPALPAPAPPSAPPAPDPSDKGFPDGTPLERMTVEQREAYWKHYARKLTRDIAARVEVARGQTLVTGTTPIPELRSDDRRAA